MLAIATFFGALVYLQLEKSTDIRRGMAGGGKQEGVVMPDPNRRTWRTCLPCLGRRGTQTPAKGAHRTGDSKGVEAVSPEPAVVDGANKGGGVATTPRGPRAALPRLAVPKLAVPRIGRRPSEGATPTPRDTARSMNSAPRTPRSPGVLYVDHP